MTDSPIDRNALQRHSTERTQRRARRALINELLEFADNLLPIPQGIELYYDDIEQLVLMLEAAADFIADIDDAALCE